MKNTHMRRRIILNSLTCLRILSTSAVVCAFVVNCFGDDVDDVDDDDEEEDAFEEVVVDVTKRRRFHISLATTEFIQRKVRTSGENMNEKMIEK